MKSLKVFFTTETASNHIDSESRGIEVFENDTLIGTGHLNLCSNWAHVDILADYESSEQKVYDQWRIQRAIEERDIMHNRILLT